MSPPDEIFELAMHRNAFAAETPDHFAQHPHTTGGANSALQTTQLDS